MRSTARRVIGGIWLTLTVLGLAQNAGPEAPPPATLFPPRYGVVNDAELRWLQSDVLPLSLTDRGKLAVSSFRGMPPGFAGFSMDGLDFVNPFRGFWNEQAVPVYQRRPLEPGVSTGRRPFSLMTPDVKRPFSRIVFSQDYIVNLNVVDITYQQRLGPNSLVHLSGGNLVGDGTGGPAFGQFKWNPYRAVARIGWSERWRTEFGYWQLRQRYRFPFITTAFATRRFTDVAHVGWVRLTGRLSERDSLVVLPSFTAMYDKYALENDVLRENRYRMAGVEAGYWRSGSRARVGTRLIGRWMHIDGKRFWNRETETQLTALADGRLRKGGVIVDGEGGVTRHSELGVAPQAELTVSRNLGASGRIALAARAWSEPAPMTWRTIDNPDLPAWTADRWIDRRTAALRLQTQPGTMLLAVEPFWAVSNGDPVLSSDARSWRAKRYEAAGVRAETAWQSGILGLWNDFTWMTGNADRFGADINNIATLGLFLRPFGDALALDAKVSWHYLGEYRRVLGEWRLMHYRLAEASDGPYHILDARIEAGFRDAVLFFVWENLLSTDYAIVDDLTEQLLIFRLGVDWQLFN